MSESESWLDWYGVATGIRCPASRPVAAEVCVTLPGSDLLRPAGLAGRAVRFGTGRLGWLVPMDEWRGNGLGERVGQWEGRGDRTNGEGGQRYVKTLLSVIVLPGRPSV